MTTETISMRVRRGTRDGSSICHNCENNYQGFCKESNKWCRLAKVDCSRSGNVDTKGKKGRYRR